MSPAKHSRPATIWYQLAFLDYPWNSSSHYYFQPTWIFHCFLNMSIYTFSYSYTFAHIVPPSWHASTPIGILQNSTDPSKLHEDFKKIPPKGNYYILLISTESLTVWTALITFCLGLQCRYTLFYYYLLLFIYLFLTALGLSCGTRDLLLRCVGSSLQCMGFSLVVACGFSLVVAQGLQDAWAL